MINAPLLEKIKQNLAVAKNRPLEGGIIPVGISNRHVHLSLADIEALFGAGYQLTPVKALSQPGQFAAKECVVVIGTKGTLSNVRVLGPARKHSQLEISCSDGFALGITAPIRESGDLQASGNAMLAGPAGYVALTSQVICAQRHIHMTPQDALRLGVYNGQKVKVRTEGQRGLIFDEVIIRVDKNFALELHIDTDEANAAGLKPNDSVILIP